MPLTQETREMQVQSLGQEDPLKEEMATHSSILAWKIPWTEEPDMEKKILPENLWQRSHGVAELDMTEATENTAQSPQKVNIILIL